MDTIQNLEGTTISIATYLEQYGLRVVVSIVFFFIATKIIKYLIKFITNLLTTKRVDETLTGPIILMVKYASYVILILIIASFLGIETTSIIMLVILVAAFIAIAMQTTIANIGAGVMLLIIKPFRVGNFVEINGNEGYVKEINLYHTLLVFRDNSVVYVPNAEVLNTDITNMEKKRKRRVDINIYVANNSDFSLIRKVILESIKGDERILDDPQPSVIVRDIDPYGAKVRTRLWVKKADYWDVLYDYNEKILQVFKKVGVTFPDTNIAYLPSK